MGSTGSPPRIDARLTRVRAAVALHRPVDERETAAKSTILRELHLLARPFDEDADRVHVTGSALVVGPKGMIMHRHRRLGRWMQPGGHVDRAELPAEAAERETREETGLAAVHPPDGPLLVHLDVHVAAFGHTHLDLRYLLLGEDEMPMPPPDESPHVKWCNWDEASSLADEALVGAIPVARKVWEEHGATWRNWLPVWTEVESDHG